MEKNELETLKKKGVLFYEFLIQSKVLSLPDTVFQESIRMVEDAYEKGDLRPLRVLSNDIDFQIRNVIPPSVIAPLIAAYKTKLGIDLNDIQSSLLKKIVRIRKRGRVINAEEYRLIGDRIEEIADDPAQSAEYLELTTLLSTFNRVDPDN